MYTVYIMPNEFCIIEQHDLTYEQAKVIVIAEVTRGIRVCVVKEE